jgi:uncharacterized damage-inducible protein DinB
MSGRDVQRLTEQNRSLLRQGRVLIDDLSGACFREVGPQLRHVLDYYGRFLADLEKGSVDYDRRERDPAVETQPDVAAERLDAVAASLAELGTKGEDRELLVKLECTDLPPDAAPWTRSSLLRELQFLVSHTIHHYALIGILLRARGVAVPEGTGVAPSTLAARNVQS